MTGTEETSRSEDHARSMLDYAAPGAKPTWDGTTLPLAFVCALLPMGLGTAIFLAWFFTRTDNLPILGLFVIAAGCVTTLIGGAAVLIYVTDQLRIREPARRWVPRAAMAACLLLANFPLAYAYVTFAKYASIRVVNRTASAITSVVIVDPQGRRTELGPIAAGGATRRHLELQGEGSVDFTATVSGPTGPTSVNGTVDGYITGPDTGIARTVTFNADGSVAVK